MRKIEIERVEINGEGRVRVRPGLKPVQGYKDIWRAGISVRWDEASRELYVEVVSEVTSLSEFQLIVRAAKQEHGDALVLTERTEFVGISEELIEEMRRFVEVRR